MCRLLLIRYDLRVISAFKRLRMGILPIVMIFKVVLLCSVLFLWEIAAFWYSTTDFFIKWTVLSFMYCSVNINYCFGKRVKTWFKRFVCVCSLKYISVFLPENTIWLIKDQVIKLHFLNQNSCIAQWRLWHQLPFVPLNSFFCVWQKGKFTYDLMEVVLCSSYVYVDVYFSSLHGKFQ